MEEKRSREIISVALRLFIICFTATLILAAVNYLTKDTITKNDDKKFQDSCMKVLPADEYEKVDIKGVKASVAKKGGKVIGICILQDVKGYSDGLMLMTGISADGSKITGIDILSHNETPGLGAKATAETYKASFAGREAPLTLDKSGKDPAYITGATKTSGGIVSGINAASKIAGTYFKDNGIAAGNEQSASQGDVKSLSQSSSKEADEK
ncbi:MAG: FMN-binding protein [Bacillota bacterium]|nr:FMN-binding protein [Bacillota bacterium]